MFRGGITDTATTGVSHTQEHNYVHPLQTPQRKWQSNQCSPYLPPSVGKLPIRKIRQRQRTEIELCQNVDSSASHVQLHAHWPSQCHRPTPNMSLGDFKLTYKTFEQLQEAICAYLHQKELILTESPVFVFLDMKDYLEAHRHECRKIYNHLPETSSVSESKDTMMKVLQYYKKCSL